MLHVVSQANPVGTVLETSCFENIGDWRYDNKFILIDVLNKTRNVFGESDG